MKTFRIKYTTTKTEEHEETINAKSKLEALQLFEQNHGDSQDNIEVYFISEEKRNWIQEAIHYADFLNLEKPEVRTTKQAKDYLYEMLDFMLSTNREGEMYEWEINMAKDLGIRVNI
jgi:predicted transposase YbfD/YdcC